MNELSGSSDELSMLREEEPIVSVSDRSPSKGVQQFPKAVDPPSPVITEKKGRNVVNYSWEIDGEKILSRCHNCLISKSDRKVLHKLVKKGCPRTYRKRLWLVASGASAAIKNNPGYYRSLVDSFIDYPNPSYSQIELDLNRTFGGDKSEETKQKLDPLKNVLNSYVKRNPSIGYCQGLNFVVAQLLRYMEEEEAFWVLCSLIETILPLDYYAYMVGVLVDQGIFRRLLRRTLPNVWTVLKKLEIDPGLVSTQWFICLFSQNIQAEVADEIWDHFFVQRSKVLFKAGLAMFALLEKNLAKCNEFVGVIETLEKESRTMKDVRALIQTMHLEKFGFINNKFICKKREIQRKRTYENLKRAGTSSGALGRKESKSKYVRKLMLYNSRLDKYENITYNKQQNLLANAGLLTCNTEWPVCLYDHTYKNRCISYFGFRCGDNVKIVEDYFDTASFSFANISPRSKQRSDSNAFHVESSSVEYQSEAPYKRLVVERSQHYCTNKEFVAKIQKLLEEEKTEGAFEDYCIGSDVNGEKTLLNAMDNYVDFIVDFDEEEDLTKEEKSPGEKPSELLGWSKADLRSDTRFGRQKPFQLSMYLSPISPGKKHEYLNKELNV